MCNRSRFGLGTVARVLIRNVGDLLLSAIIIDTPETLDYLAIGNKVMVVFKETEVVLGLDTEQQISLQNRIPGSVAAIERGTLLSRVTLDTAVGSIVSVITSNAVAQLGLEVGSAAVALVKTNEIMLSA